MMRWTAYAALLLLPRLALAQSAPLAPAEAPLSTDRPGNGNAATTVDRGRLQIEFGGNYAYTDGSPEEHRISFPLGIRFGIVDRLEARVISSVIGIRNAGSETDVEPTDTSLGLKVAVLRARGWVPDLALMTDVFFPTGEESFTDDIVNPETRAAVAWSLPAGFGLLGNFGFDLPEDGSGDRFARFLYLGQLNYGFDVGDDFVGVFAETFGRTSFDARSDLFQLDFGLLWRLTPNVQVDLFTQHGLTDDAPDFQVAAGISFRT